MPENPETTRLREWVNARQSEGETVVVDTVHGMLPVESVQEWRGMPEYHCKGGITILASLCSMGCL